MKSFQVALIQQACSPDTTTNIENTSEQVVNAAKAGAKLILLQELHTDRYFCQTEQAHFFDLAHPIPGPQTDHFSKLAKQLSVVLVTSLFEKRAPGLYHNTAAVFEKDGSLAGLYRKMHIPDDPGFYEKFYFAPGDLGFTPINTSVGKLGVLICWDQWYPEAARIMALKGADLLLYPTAIGWGTQETDPEERARQKNAWISIQRAHAIANALPVLVCNRVGFEPATPGSQQGIHFWGNSFVAGPQGELLSQANDDVCILHAEIDRSKTETVRRGWPFFRDRRIDSFDVIKERWAAG